MKQKKIMYSVLLLVLFLPFFQDLFNFIPHSLYGYYKTMDKPSFSLKRWFTAEYQEEYARYIEENIGFRNIFIKINHQIQYSLFSKTNAFETTIGENNHLYQYEFIRSYLGTNFCGTNTVNQIAINLFDCQKKLKQRNIDLIVVLVPGKASLYPEFLPSKYKRMPIGPTNYNTYKTAFEKQSVNCIDFVSFFKKVKDTTQIPIFYEQAMHWTQYHAEKAMDSIIRYIEKKRNINIPEYFLVGYERPEKFDGDCDLENNMNLLFKINHTPFIKPVIKFSDSVNKPQCSVLVIGDSFYGQMLDMGIPQHLFSSWDYWFYGKDLQNNIKHNVSEINYTEEVHKHNVVLLFATEASLTIDKFPFGFIDGYK